MTIGRVSAGAVALYGIFVGAPSLGQRRYFLTGRLRQTYLIFPSLFWKTVTLEVYFFFLRFFSSSFSY